MVLTARLDKAIERILFLHACEQEGIELPTSDEWIAAVVELEGAWVASRGRGAE